VTSPDQLDGGTELDGGVSEPDRDSTEQELAAALAVLLASKAASAPWLALVQGSTAGILQNYLRRASLDMATAAGLSTTDAAVAADEATTAVMGDVQRHLASWLAISAQDHATKAAEETAAAPKGEPAPPVPKPGQPMSQDHAETAAGMIARTVTTYARERVRGEIATKLGATKRRWQTRMDSRVRPAHKSLEGRWKPVGKPFKSGGFEIQYPGDPSAPLELTAGCRCHLIWLIR
jgi:hypothetical protein